LFLWQQLNYLSRDIRFGFVHRIRTSFTEKHPISNVFDYCREAFIPGATVGVGQTLFLVEVSLRDNAA
jgi:hypothetical protein